MKCIGCSLNDHWISTLYSLDWICWIYTLHGCPGLHIYNQGKYCLKLVVYRDGLGKIMEIGQRWKYAKKTIRHTVAWHVSLCWLPYIRNGCRDSFLVLFHIFLQGFWMQQMQGSFLHSFIPALFPSFCNIKGWNSQNLTVIKPKTNMHETTLKETFTKQLYNTACAYIRSEKNVS